MKKHNIALTYAPKIEAVLDGRCTQTIRAGRRFEVGDLVSFHGWEGVPYRSKWSFKTPYKKILEVYNVRFFEWGFLHNGTEHIWRGSVCKRVAERDYINPPTGEALRDVLFGLNAKGSHFEAQIIRW
jgi:hypothetical protein